MQSNPAAEYDECPVCEQEYDNILREGTGQHHEPRDSAEACRYQEARSAFRLVFVHLEGSDE